MLNKFRNRHPQNSLHIYQHTLNIQFGIFNLLFTSQILSNFTSLQKKPTCEITMQSVRMYLFCVPLYKLLNPLAEFH
jgi:hypothetical protein